MAENSTASVRRRGPGRPFLPGQSPNPAGRPKAALDVQALARQHTTAAIQTLADCLHDPKLKVQAAEALLNRAWGRPLQAISMDDAAGSLTALHLLAARTIAAAGLEQVTGARLIEASTTEPSGTPPDFYAPALE